MADYTRYVDYVRTLTTGSTSFADNAFKCHPDYRYMLEHVSREIGWKYLELIRKEFQLSNSEILEFTDRNDSYGSPIHYQYEELLVSPTSLRYIYQAHVILSYLQLLNYEDVNIFELGGGYGGLAIAINHYSPKYHIFIEKYTICDLSEVIRLQRMYLSKFPYQIEFCDAKTYGKDIDPNMFFISCYCFSEIQSEHQHGYIEHLLPKCDHGFISWNHIPVFDFGKQLVVTDEKPVTGDFNKWVLF